MGVARRTTQKGSMKVREALAVIDQMSYKPGWRIEAKPIIDKFGYDALEVSLRMRVTDAYDHSRTVMFQSAAVLHMLERQDEEGLVRDVMRLIERAEVHEAREFFTYRGERPFDPHDSVLEEGKRYG